MCGIAGLIKANDDGLHRAFVQRMQEKLRRRGPDDWGWLASGRGEVVRGREEAIALEGIEVSLVHRRLSILDLSPAGWQPLERGGGRYYITYNGEIYNFIELRRELELLGHEFVSSSDTEVLVAALIQWGKAALNRLMGMFAFAFWDVEAGTLLLARDQLGIKPLFYTSVLGGGFAFASELRGLVWDRLRGTSRLSADGIYRFLRWGSSNLDGETMVEGLKTLPPGHFLEVQTKSAGTSVRPGQPRPFWQARIPPRFEGSFEEAVSKTRSLFLDSVDKHMRSDVPVGAALSGGVDSSAIVMAMRQLHGKSLELHTFGYCASSPKWDESRWISLVSEASGAITHKVFIGEDDLWNEADEFIMDQDSPVATTSPLAQRFVFRKAAEVGIKVVLGGQGADELLGGYPVYLSARLAAMIHRGQWSEALSFLRAGRAWPGREGLLVRAGQYLLPPRLQRLARRLVGEELAPPWLRQSWFKEQGVVFKERRLTAGSGDCLRQELLETLTRTSLPMLLRHEDRNAMTYSIENRVPFVTVEMADWCLSMPDHFVISPEGETKSVLRAALRGLVPDPILERKDKIGFVTPEDHWLVRDPQRTDALLQAEHVRAFKPLDHARVLEHWDDVKAGRRRFSSIIWRWINLTRWARLMDLELPC